jgi:RNase adaptor protein for sRNA GlmZ degradation
VPLSAIKLKAEVMTADESVDGKILTTRVKDQYSCSVFMKLLIRYPDVTHYFLQHLKVDSGLVLKIIDHRFLPNPSYNTMFENRVLRRIFGPKRDEVS